jgi:branched-chain amino acid transport system permease protein
MTTFIQGLMTGILMGCVYAFFAIGFTLVLGVMKVVNFAHGTFVVMGMYLTIFVFMNYLWDPFLSLLVVIPSMFVFGIIIYYLVIRPIMQQPLSAHVIATIGLLIVIENVITLIFGSQYRTVTVPYTTSAIVVGSIRIGIARMLAAATSLFVIGLFYLLLHKTDFGRAVRACADDIEGAWGLGIDVHRTYLIAFGIGSVLAGISGAVVMPFAVASPGGGLDIVIKTFVIVIIGGMGSVGGALLGGLIIGVVEGIVSALWSPAIAIAAVFVILIIMLAMKPEGFLKRISE